MISVSQGFKRIKRIRSYTGHAQFLAECDEGLVGIIDRVIRSPYHFSPDQQVMQWGDTRVIVVETSHRCYDVFRVPAGYPIKGISEGGAL